MPIPSQPGDYYIWTLSADMVVSDAQSLLDGGGQFTPGQQYYIYLVLGSDNASATLSVSLNSLAPSTATTANSRLIGGFHTLCTSVGTGLTYMRGDQTVNHELNGFLSGDILPLSIWDLRHRPSQNKIPNAGIVWERYLDFWPDIYLPSGTGPTTASVFGATITGSQTARQCVDFIEDMGCVGKILLSDEEFAMAALGSNEQTNIQGSAQKMTAGGAVDTAGRRMISYCGCEEMCGSYWQWLRNINAGGQLGVYSGQIPGSSPATYGNVIGNPTGIAGLGATNANTLPNLSGGKGGQQWLVGALLAGGNWNSGAICGSRPRRGSLSRSFADVSNVGRGREAG
jgi:hypothetical protein